MASFCTGVGIGALVGACRSLFMLFSSKTAWFATLTFSLVAYLSYFLALGTLPIAGQPRRHYRLQDAGVYVCWGCFSRSVAVGVSNRATCSWRWRTRAHPALRSYAALYSKLIYYVCFIFAFYLVLSYLTQSLSPKSVVLLLLAFPATYIIAPFVMLFKSGIWLPIALQYGGLVAANVVLAFHNPARENSKSNKDFAHYRKLVLGSGRWLRPTHQIFFAAYQMKPHER